MAIPVLIIGRSGSGKTYSLKNFKPDEVGVISVEKGRLPFRSEIKTVKVPKDPTNGEARDAAQLNAAKYAWIMRAIEKAAVKTIVIDDSQYLLVNELFDRTYEKGYDKFTSMAQKFRDLNIKSTAQRLVQIRAGYRMSFLPGRDFLIGYIQTTAEHGLSKLLLFSALCNKLANRFLSHNLPPKKKSDSVLSL